MGHIFISYSHQDTDYAHRLADTLQTEGFDVWIDARLDYGSQWPHEVQKQLDACDAFILIMTPRAYASEWVQSELQRAKRKLKPIFPLLLEGDEPWLSVESTQYYDVRGEKFPDARFYSALRRVAERHEGQAVQLPADKGNKLLKPKSSVGPPKIKTEIVIAIIGAIATLLAAVIPFILSNRSQNPTPPPANNVTNVTATFPASSSDETPIASATSSTSSEIPSNAPDISDSPDFTDSKDVPMRPVPAGNFIMGSNAVYDNEKPVHNVYLDDFLIDRDEVTNALYKACVEEGVCRQPNETGSFTRDSYYGNPQFDNYPVVYVDWEDAMSYCQWRGMELPTEAQWEKAARGTDGRTYPWGENIDDTYANFNHKIDDTTAVGTYEIGKSPYGVYDMAGNAWEWVRDWYSATYYLSSPLINPSGPDTAQYRVLRGGSWADEGIIVRAANRGWNELKWFYNVDFGFRCAMDGTP